MGAGISVFAAAETPPNSSPSLGDIPESCISSILMHFDPPEICKLALLSRTFHGASLADFVWETKLPSNYKYLVRKVLGQNPEKVHKKEIYTRLCQPNRFDNNTKETWLDKRSGQVCVSISAKAMKITGIDDRRYWNQIKTDESRFQNVAYLQQIWWFEATGEIEFEFPRGPTAYSSDSSSAKPPKGLADVFVIWNKFMVGPLSLSDSSFQHPMVRKPYPNAVCVNLEAGFSITLEIFPSRILTAP